MKILSITTQKPHSTGSGTYMTELVHSFSKAGVEQAVVAGITSEDHVKFPSSVKFYPVYYNTKALPFPVLGMSDVMPYESTKYCDITPLMAKQMHDAFISQIRNAIVDLQPDLILCHHLFLLTAMVREAFPNLSICCIAHGSDIRQMENLLSEHSYHGSRAWAGGISTDYIRENIGKLDRIYALHDVQVDQIKDLYKIDPDKVTVIGSGYNSEVFYPRDHSLNVTDLSIEKPVKIVYAGKICREKGIRSLVNALNSIYEKENRCGNFELILAGGYKDSTIGDLFNLSNNEELLTGNIEALPFPATYMGMLSQEDLADLFRECEIFVLPSFYEGLGLVLIEAMACGLLTISTDLPGVKAWIQKSVPGSNTAFIEAPEMEYSDMPKPESLLKFEEDLKDALAAAICKIMDLRKSGNHVALPDTSGISWDGVAAKIFGTFKII